MRTSTRISRAPLCLGLVVVVMGMASLARAELRVFACEPEWAALAEELGGDQVEANSAVTGLQDMHYIQARPSLIARVRRADLVICTGAELEIGWLPLLLRQASNARVQPGAPWLYGRDGLRGVTGRSGSVRSCTG